MLTIEEEINQTERRSGQVGSYMDSVSNLGVVQIVQWVQGIYFRQWAYVTKRCSCCMR